MIDVEILTNKQIDVGVEGSKVGFPGQPGYSAYQIAVFNGFEGTEKEWLASLIGEPGENGISAYEVAVEQGFEGSVSEWLASLNGQNGDSVFVSHVEEVSEDDGYNTVIFSDNSFLRVKNGKTGAKGDNGADGLPGKDGKDGKDYVISPDDYDAIADVTKEKIGLPELATKTYVDNVFLGKFNEHFAEVHGLRLEDLGEVDLDELEGDIDVFFKYSNDLRLLPFHRQLGWLPLVCACRIG